ncbi:PhoH family protein [Apibacter raozihei]|uniref:PhoH family protein n=1 Tax=Apibacter TaxID=1778601 RepID=UPI000FE35EBC|nr:MULTISPECIES: PhoH family protein [Apibacter]
MAKKKIVSEKRIFVLDTSVIIFNHLSITLFAEHDIVIPITVLEELDNFKKGNDTKNYEAREFIRFLDKCSLNKDINNWIDLPGENKGKFKIVMSTNGVSYSATKIFDSNSMDNKILNVCLKLKEDEKDRTVTLVSKDVNLRLKARAIGLNAEDFETGKVKVDNLPSGIEKVENFDQQLIDEIHKKQVIPYSKIKGKLNIYPNACYILQGRKSSALAYYNPFTEELEVVSKKAFYKINPRNAEQAFAMYVMAKPELKLIALHGVAGTGKTLLALVSALEERRDYKQIYLARPIIPLSNKDIGFLPGDIKSKLDPYMQPLWDNLKFIQNQFNENDKEFKQISQMVEQEKLLITPLAYIRGRSLSDVIFIVDEAQNLTPHEVKTIISRAGENSKFIFTGDVKQIDTPYLDEQSNGLSYLVDRIHGRNLFAHIRLEKGERSELANLANELL